MATNNKNRQSNLFAPFLMQEGANSYKLSTGLLKLKYPTGDNKGSYTQRKFVIHANTPTNYRISASQRIKFVND